MDFAPTKLHRLFYSVTGVGLIGLIAGFSYCLFDIDGIDQCIEHANTVLDAINSFFRYLMEWLFALCDTLFNRSEILPN